jgi:hypothetical protein
MLAGGSGSHPNAEDTKWKTRKQPRHKKRGVHKEQDQAHGEKCRYQERLLRKLSE